MPFSSATEPVYDTSLLLSPTTSARALWRRRELIMLLAKREVVGKYHQALLGAAWTVITPLVYAGTLWLVFSHLARFTSGGVPYVVYVLSGVVVLNFVTQGVLGVAGTVTTNVVARRRSFVPVGVFAAASALASVVSLGLTTLTLLVVQLVTHAGIPPTALLLPVLVLLLALAVAGAGLLVGTLAAFFFDTIEITRIALTLVGFLTPVFYPLSIVPRRFRYVIEANPISSFLRAFRDLAYGGHLPPWWTVVVCVATAACLSAAGLVVFARVRQALPSLL